MKAETIPGLFRERIEKTPRAPAHAVRDANGVWQTTGWEAAGQNVRSLTRGLIDLGLKPGRHIGILAATSQAWDLMQLAVLSAGGVVVGVDPFDTEENINLIVDRADVTALVVQEPHLVQKLNAGLRARLLFVVAVQRADEDQKEYVSLKKLLACEDPGSWDGIDVSFPEAPATIIFTSGTTGRPKGICYTHRQVVLACRSIAEAFPGLGEGSKLVCWLPLSNLFQRMINHCTMMINGTTYFVTDPRKILDRLPEIKPDVFIGVPRLFEKVYEGLVQEIHKKPAPVRLMIKLALRVGNEHATCLRENRTESIGNRFLFKLLDPLILKRFRTVLGGNISFMISGSAPMPVWLLERFQAMGLLILEAYGISENIVPMAINRPYAYKFGSVGKPLPTNDIRLSESKELLVKSKGVCTAYYTGEKENPCLDSQGYLHTGDLASIDENGFICLIGRCSEMIKTSTGRRIAPAGIEDRLRKISFVEQAVVFGDNRKHLVAVLVISEHNQDSLEIKHNKGIGNWSGTISENVVPAIKQEVLQEILNLPAYQRPTGLILTPEPFTIQGGELTSNLKLRRQVVFEKFKTSIDELYRILSERKQKQGELEVITL